MKPPEKKPDPGEKPKGKHPGRPEPPAAAERIDDERKPSPNERIREAPDTDVPAHTEITNQDEQDKVTNAGTDNPPQPEK